MKKHFKRVHQAITEWITQVLFRKIILPVVLTFTYFFILGPTSLMAKVFFSSSLAKSSKTHDSNWVNISAAEKKLEDSKKQS